MKFLNKTIVLLLSCCIFQGIATKAQQNFDVKPKYNTVMVPVHTKSATSFSSLKKAEADNDSLTNVIAQLNETNNNSLLAGKKKDSIIIEMEDKLTKLQNANTDLERKLNNYKGENLKLDQSNRILIIFNSIVGILLLSTLIWFLRNIGKRKSGEKNKIISVTEPVQVTEVKPAPVSVPKNDHQYFENKLDQLERLGSLRDKGILNEEEFAAQKQQLLGNI